MWIPRSSYKAPGWRLAFPAFRILRFNLRRSRVLVSGLKFSMNLLLFNVSRFKVSTEFLSLDAPCADPTTSESAFSSGFDIEENSAGAEFPLVKEAAGFFAIGAPVAEVTGV